MNDCLPQLITPASCLLLLMKCLTFLGLTLLKGFVFIFFFFLDFFWVPWEYAGEVSSAAMSLLIILLVLV